MRTEKLLLVDSWNVFIANNATVHIEDHNTNPVGAYIGSLNTLRTLIDKFKPTKVIFVFDGPDAGERRRQLYPEYKGGRRIRERESKVQIMEGEDNLVFGVEGAFQNQLLKIYDFLKLLPVTVCMIPYCEADDAITYLALKNKDKFDCIIVSNDKDYLQLVQPGVLVYRWKTRKLFDEGAFMSEFNLKAENYIFKKIMLGDTSDKVEGIKGVGEKTFVKLEEPLSNKIYSDISEFIEMLETIDHSTLSTKESNTFKKVLDQRYKMELGYKIMKLNEDCLLQEQKTILGLQIEEQKHKTFSRLSAKIKVKSVPFNKLYNGFNDDKCLQPFAFLKAGIEIIY